MSIQFWRSKDFSDESFLDLIDRTFGVTFTGTTEARTWLKNNGYFTSYPDIVDDGLIISLDPQNKSSYKGEPTINLSPITYEKTGSNEYLPYFSGLDDIFDTHGIDVPYWVSFEARSPVSGGVIMYTSDTSSRKYSFTTQNFTITTEWKKYTLPINNISIYDNTQTNNRLSFYGTYGTGRIISVKNLQLEQKEYSTPFVNGTRGLTCDTGGGLCNLVNSNYNAQLYYDNNYMHFSSASGNTIYISGEHDNTQNGNFIIGVGDLATSVNNNFTTSCWINRQESYKATICEYRGISRRLEFAVNDTSMYFSQREVNDPFNTNSTSVSTINSLNEWNYFTLSKNGNLWSFYKDDTLIGTNTFNMSETISTGSYYSIGIAWTDDDYRSNGMVGFVGPFKHYNKALTSTEISNNFNVQKIRFGL